MSAPPHAPDPSTLLALVQFARRVLDKWPEDRPVPKEVEAALSCFYNLTDYHGIAPADAPHIPNDGMI